jgi:putative copper export protein
LNTRAAIGGAGLALLSFALMGHTVIHELRWLLAPLLLVHVGAGALWLGALAGLYIAVRDTGSAGAPLVARFSAHATWLVGGLLVCGVGMSVIFIRSFAELATPYGAIVLGKALGFAVLLGLAGLNRWRFGPGLSAGDSGAARRLERTIVAEWLLIAAVLAATAAMTALFAPEHLEGAFAPEHDVRPTH